MVSNNKKIMEIDFVANSVIWAWTLGKEDNQSYLKISMSTTELFHFFIM